MVEPRVFKKGRNVSSNKSTLIVLASSAKLERRKLSSVESCNMSQSQSKSAISRLRLASKTRRADEQSEDTKQLLGQVDSEGPRHLEQEGQIHSTFVV